MLYPYQCLQLVVEDILLLTLGCWEPADIACMLLCLLEPRPESHLHGVANSQFIYISYFTLLHAKVCYYCVLWQLKGA